MVSTAGGGGAKVPFVSDDESSEGLMLNGLGDFGMFVALKIGS